LNYTNGSPCRTSSSSKSDDVSRKAETRRKSTIISFLCDREPPEPKAPKAAISFIGTDEDECVYIFEAKSMAACPAIETSSAQLGPGGVFGVM
jgi:cation-dependent mannose-6-phosphate receptor